LLPEYAIGWENGDLLLRNYEGNTFRTPTITPSRKTYIKTGRIYGRG